MNARTSLLTIALATLGIATACHGIDDYGYHAMDRAGWNERIELLNQVFGGHAV